MATGDIRNNLERLKRELVQIRFQGDLDIVGMRLGDPAAFLPVLNYCMVKFSRHVASEIAAGGLELQGKSDSRFLETAFKVFRDIFGLKPVLSAAQFLEQGYSERKVLLVTDVVKHCKRQHQSAVRRQRLAAAKPLREGSPRVQKENTQARANNASAKDHSASSRDAAKDQKQALTQPRRQQPVAKRNHAAEEIAQPTSAPSQDAAAQQPGGNSKAPRAGSWQSGPPHNEPESCRPETHPNSQSHGRVPGHSSGQSAIHESAANAAGAPGNAYQALPRAFVWPRDPGLVQQHPQNVLPPLPSFMPQGDRALAPGWQQPQLPQNQHPHQHPAWEAASSAANGFARVDPSKAGSAALGQPQPQPQAFRGEQPGTTNTHNNVLMGSGSAAVAGYLQGQPGAGALPATTQQAQPRGTPGHGGLKSRAGSLRQQQQQLQSPHSTAGGSSWFSNPTFSHPGSSGGPPTPSSHPTQPPAGPLGSGMGQQPLLSPLRPQDGSGAALSRSPPHTLRSHHGPLGRGQGSGASPLPGRDPIQAPNMDAPDDSQRTNHQQHAPSQTACATFQHLQPRHQPSTVHDKHDEAGESARSIQHQPRQQQQQQQQQTHSESQGWQAPCPEQPAAISGSLPQQAPASRQGSDRDHAHDVLAARVTLLEGRVRFLEGKLQAVQAWQEASQAPPQNNTSAGQHVRPPNTGLSGETNRAPLALPQSMSPRTISADPGLAAPGTTMSSVLHKLESPSLDPNSPLQSSAAAHAERSQTCAATPGSTRSDDLRADVKAGASLHNAAPSWAQHVSGMHAKSPLLGRRIGSTGADASSQGSPMSGQSTQDLIEGIESRYQQARAILRSYQR